MSSSTTLKPGIDWVGFVDWNVRDFHGYNTDRGATYNAYLVADEQTAVIDTVKAPFVDHLLRNLAAKTDLAKIDYVVCNHAEPDHSSGFPALLRLLEPLAINRGAGAQRVRERLHIAALVADASPEGAAGTFCYGPEGARAALLRLGVTGIIEGLVMPVRGLLSALVWR